MNTPSSVAKKLCVSIVIPVCNEAVVIEHNVLAIQKKMEEIPDLEWELLIIENGSTDNTVKIAQRLCETYEPLQLYSLPKANYGVALQHGMQAATGKIIINFDIDYWDVEFVNLASHIMEIKYDIIIASKNLMLSNDHRGSLRKFASFTFRFILFFAFGLRVSDTHGIKAWKNTKNMQNYFSQSVPPHHTYDTEVIVRAMQDNCDVLEVSVEVFESRESDRLIAKRVPQALKELFDMFKRLRWKK